MPVRVKKAVPQSRICYLSADGMTDPLGRSQVLPYLAGLADLGHQITILSLEKSDRLALSGNIVRGICEKVGIDWHPLIYSRRPPVLAGIWNLRQLSHKALDHHRRRPFDIVHARSDMAATAAKSLWADRGVKLLYDMRALWPDERVEGGAWPQSNPLYRAIFRYFKSRQQEFLNHASAIVTLTNRGKKILEHWPERTGEAPVTVIQCCADFDHFDIKSVRQRELVRAQLGIDSDTKVLAYLGSIGSWYMLDEMLEFFIRYRHRYLKAKMLMVTQDNEAAIRAKAVVLGIADDVIVVPANRERVPELLGSADLGVSFIMPVFSKQVSSPTKMGEMLACGLPVVGNSGVGDVDRIIEDIGGGVVIDKFTNEQFDRAIVEIEKLTIEPKLIRDGARRWFDLADGIRSYDGVYRSLLTRK